MSERTTWECIQHFNNVVNKMYAIEFLRRPTSHDEAILYQKHEEKHHIPGMKDNIDCTHVVWRLCPKHLWFMYIRGDHEYPTVML